MLTSNLNIIARELIVSSVLLNILNNFSYDELAEMLPKGSLDFTIGLREDQGESTVSDLAKIVMSTVGSDFVLRKDLREKLICRMLPSHLSELFPEFNIKSSAVTPSHYDAIASWSEANIEAFSAKLEMSDAIEALQFLNTSIDTIVKIEPEYGLYPYQKDISDEVLKRLSRSSTRLMVHLPTGAGKTRTAMNIIAQHLRADSKNIVLWLADREELCTQALDEFKKSWKALGNRTCTGYGFYSQSDVSLSGITSGCIVAGLHKLLRIRKTDSRKLQLLYEELRSKVTLVVFDEAHKAIASEYSAVVTDFIGNTSFKASLIGLSATPGRTFLQNGTSDSNEALAKFFGNQKVSMKVQGYLSPVDYLVEKGFLAKATFKSIAYEQSEVYGYSLRGLNDVDTNKALAAHNARNKTIKDIVLKECLSGSQIILFACSVDHAQKLAVALNFYGIRAASIDSKTDSLESRRSKITRYKKGDLQVLTNFGVLTAGFDAPRTNVAIIAKPTKSLVEYLQMAGRAMRGVHSGGNAECTIYTVLDEIPEFNNVSIGTSHWNGLWKEYNSNE